MDQLDVLIEKWKARVEGVIDRCHGRSVSDEEDAIPREAAVDVLRGVLAAARDPDRDPESPIHYEGIIESWITRLTMARLEKK